MEEETHINTDGRKHRWTQIREYKNLSRVRFGRGQEEFAAKKGKTRRESFER
jgi:hypothetical protein